MAEEGWSELPTDLLASIVEQLPTVDRARFRSVCTTWNSTSPPLRPPLETPCLLFSQSGPDLGSDEQKNDQRKQQCPSPPQQMVFYSISDDMTYKLSSHLADVMTDCRVIVSYSPCGWLMYMDKVCDLQCIHLPSGERIHPPSITTFSCVNGVEVDSQGRLTGYHIHDGYDTELYECDLLNWFYSRAIIIFHGFPPDYNPTTENNHNWTIGTDLDYVIVVVHHFLGDLAFARRGDKSWTSLKVDVPFSRFANFILYRGSLYVVDKNGKNIARIEVNSDLSFGSMSALPCNLENEFCSSFAYFVVIDDHLWLIRRHTTVIDPEQEQEQEPEPDLEETNDVEEDDDDNSDLAYLSYTPKTLNFQLFEFDGTQVTWVKKDTIGDYAIFIGNNYSLAISTHEFPQLNRDCIYFADDYSETYGRPTWWDLGVYNLQDQSVSPYYEGPVSMHLPQPIWVMPSSFYDL